MTDEMVPRWIADAMQQRAEVAEAEVERLREALQHVARSPVRLFGPEFVEVKLDRATWDAIVVAPDEERTR
jgi:hypothetical protein